MEERKDIKKITAQMLHEQPLEYFIKGIQTAFENYEAIKNVDLRRELALPNLNSTLVLTLQKVILMMQTGQEYIPIDAAMRLLNDAEWVASFVSTYKNKDKN